MTDTSPPVVIVTGSSGLLGVRVCLALADMGYMVYGFDRVGLPEPPKDHPLVRDIECDVTEYATVRGAIEELRRDGVQRVASVVHLAAYYDFSGEDSPLYETVTVEGTDRMLNALGGMEIEQFLFVSTMLVHPPCKPGDRIHEDDPLEAKWPYPDSKIRTERLIREGHPEVHSLLLRMAGVYTDWGQQPTLVQQIKRIYERDLQAHFFPGDPETGQSAIYLDDAVESIVLGVEHRREIEAKTAILVGEPDPPSYETLQHAIGERIHGKEWSTMRIPKSVAKVGAAINDAVSGGEAFIKPFMVAMADDHYALDIQRAKKMLGWQPRHSLMEMLPKIIDSLLEDPQGWYEKNGLEPPEK